LQTDKPVLCAGALLPDFIVAPRVRTGVRLMLGGTSGNTAFGLARLGVPTMILAKVGDDYHGRLLRDDMAASGVDTECVALDETAPTMINIAVAESSGERFMFTWPDDGSALWEIRPEDVPDDLVSRVGWVQFCGATLENDPAGQTLGELAERCAAADVTVSVDLNLRTECFGWNESYASNIQRVIDVSTVVFGATHDEYPYFTAAPRDLVTEDRMVIAREGRAGCTLYTSACEYTVGIYDLPVADTVGAGDAFNSGFIAAAALGLPPGDCLVWGNACGNYSVQFEGGHSCPDRATLLTFLEENAEHSHVEVVGTT
jgi:sugar/nucleoside kinase (ribokinase family)